MLYIVATLPVKVIKFRKRPNMSWKNQGSSISYPKSEKVRELDKISLQSPIKVSVLTYSTLKNK